MTLKEFRKLKVGDKLVLLKSNASGTPFAKGGIITVYGKLPFGLGFGFFANYFGRLMSWNFLEKYHQDIEKIRE